MTWPINYVRTWLQRSGLAASVRQAANRRNTMTGCNWFDAEMHRDITRHYTEAQRKDLLLIQSGGLWTSHGLSKAGYLRNDCCLWCQGEVETLEHLWWECPAWECFRTEVRTLIPAGTHRTLPPCLALHGLPTECSGDLHGDVWRQQDTTWETEDLDATPKETPTRTNQPQLTGDEAIAWNCARAVASARSRAHAYDTTADR